MMSLFDHRVVPLASIDDIRDVDAIGEGLTRGGLPVVEVALRGEHGMPALARLAERGDLLVGAGTVLTESQAHQALAGGAAFLVTPGLDPAIVEIARDAGVPIVPGVLTPTEIQDALRLGLTRLKLFPAGVFGGLKLVEAYAAVFREVRFMPSGGVSPQNLGQFLASPAVFAASGSWITAAASDGADAVADRARAAAEMATVDA